MTTKFQKFRVGNIIARLERDFMMGVEYRMSEIEPDGEIDPSSDGLEDLSMLQESNDEDEFKEFIWDISWTTYPCLAAYMSVISGIYFLWILSKI